ncbi:hypothetical protein DPEC_G00051890 [Dallia pectoralis]|uniref:Uncharacterized protein n=1 Tax=Dallia pectoralis TaxID=75939 RepID=A0ACC2HC25_DALPE|nr:hypothetical protein DPEC_G00051890 [Dallia pectoralis]
MSSGRKLKMSVNQQQKLLETIRLGTTTVPLVRLDMPGGSRISSPSPDSTPSLTSCPPTPSPQPSLHDLSHTGSSGITRPWPETFRVPWDIMPIEIQKDIFNGRRPSPCMRMKMVRILADEVRKYSTNPSLSECLTICQQITSQYPDSFADITSSGKVRAGRNSTLLTQLKNRIENMNRPRNINRKRSSGSCGVAGVEHEPNGCTEFQEQLPPEESDVTVEEKRQRLESLYGEEGINGGERSEVTELMRTTFSLQRQHINDIPASSVADLQLKWPFLFTQKGIYSHFELLTDVNVHRTLELAIAECGKTIVEYMRTKGKINDVQAVLQRENYDLTMHVTLLLMAHFNELPEGLILNTCETATAADIEASVTLPASPRLILRRTEQAVAGWMVSMEGRIICEGVQPTFITGLAAVFATFYIFNLQYQDEAAQTLEFIQRRFIGINPETGKKVGHGMIMSKKTDEMFQKKTHSVNQQVATLLKNLIDFEWHLKKRARLQGGGRKKSLKYDKKEALVNVKKTQPKSTQEVDEGDKLRPKEEMSKDGEMASQVALTEVGAPEQFQFQYGLDGPTFRHDIGQSSKSHLSIVKVEHLDPVVLELNDTSCGSGSPDGSGPPGSSGSGLGSGTCPATQFFSMCQQAGCTQFIFSEFASRLSTITERIASQQASEEDFNLTLKVLEASGMLPEIFAKRDQEMEKRLRELQKETEALRTARSAMRDACVMSLSST